MRLKLVELALNDFIDKLLSGRVVGVPGRAHLADTATASYDRDLSAAKLLSRLMLVVGVAAAGVLTLLVVRFWVAAPLAVASLAGLVAAGLAFVVVLLARTRR